MARGTHWADACAESIARNRGDKPEYVVACGLTPLGPPSLSGFREALSADFVARALADSGRPSRFVFSWDEYDVFRRVPPGAHPALAAFLRMPLVLVPDPEEREESVAAAFERAFEDCLARAGIRPEFVRQAERYRSGAYAHGIRMALRASAAIKRILDAWRTEPLPESWSPLSIYCSSCARDSTSVLSWDGEWTVRWECSSCGAADVADLRSCPLAKPYWRIDWPMRWAWEDTDFEPARKDHHAHGGSFDTAAEIAREVYGREPPLSFSYGRLAARAAPDAPALSLGRSPDDPRAVLDAYESEVLRYLVARAKPATDLAIPLDAEIFGAYEDYDRAERAYWGLERLSDPEEDLKERRLYELAQAGSRPRLIPYQAPFRLICELALLKRLDPAAVVSALPNLPADRLGRVRERAERAVAWLLDWAPRDFLFSPRDESGLPGTEGRDAALARAAADALERGSWDERGVAEAVAAFQAETGLDAKGAARLVCRACLGRDHGPRPSTLALALGRERMLALLRGGIDDARA